MKLASTAAGKTVLCAVLLVVPGGVLLAERPEDQVSVLLDLVSSETSGQDFDVGLRTTPQVTFTGGEIVGVDLGRSVFPRVAVVFHSAGGNHFTVSFRRYNRNKEESFSSGVGFYPILVSPGTGIDFANKIGSRVSMTLETADLSWARPMASTPKSEWLWGAGLRWLRYRSDWKTDYDSGADIVRIKDESSGVGVTFGIQGRYRFSGTVSLSGGVGVGLIKGSTDAGYAEAAPSATAGIARNNQDRIFQTLDAAARAVFSLTRHVDLSLGYQFTRATNLLTRDRIVDNDQPTSFTIAVSSTIRDVAFDGPLLGLAVNW